MKLKVKKLHPDAVIPKYATAGAACFDLVAIDGGVVAHRTWPNRIFSTGLSFEVPAGWAMLVYSRSGHGFKSDIRLANCVGIIDSDYRGEVKVKLTADDEGILTVNKGDRIAQAMLVPVHKVEMVEVSDLSDTERGAGGFGSTGQ